MDNIITFLTGITVILLFFYTGETYRLRKETQKQTENIFTPYLALKNLEGQLYLINLGKGIAKDVVFNPDIKINGELVANISVIGPGEEKGISVLSKEGDGFWSVLYREAPNDISFVYWDTLGNKYKANFVKVSQYLGGFSQMSQRRL